MRTRRGFLSTAGKASLAAWAAAGNACVAMAADGPEAAVLRTLTRMARLIYPHDGLADAVYAGIVGELLGDPQNGTVLRTGVAQLGDFLELDEAGQIAVLQAMQDSVFFNAVKTPLMWALYNAVELWALIDYPGPSFAFGGYIRRGFDDIDWLQAS